MNVSLDLSPGQLSKLRNGHGIRVSRAMFGGGVDMIIDPMTFNNLMKKLEKGKGAIISMSGSEIEQNKMEGTGLFAGSGNRSGKISRIKKARKWRDFSNDTARMGIDTGRYGYEQFQEATNPLKSEGKKAIKGLSKMFGGEMEEMEGDGFFKDIKKGYNRKVKNSDLGKALRGTARSAISDGYDLGQKELGKYKYGKPVSQYMRNKKGSNVDKLTGYTGLGLKLAGNGKFKSAVVEKPSMADMKRMMAKHGRGLRMSGGECEACNGSGMMNDKFLFQDIAL
jgi:hypothetical protein